MPQLGTLMGENRNALSWGKTIFVDEKDQFTSKSTSSPRQNCCTAMKLHKAIPLPNPRSLTPGTQLLTAASFNPFYRQCLG
jgi:hypothetical protein